MATEASIDTVNETNIRTWLPIGGGDNSGSNGHMELHSRGASGTHRRTMRHVVEAPDTYPKTVRKHGLHLRHARVHDTGNRDPASR